MNLLHRPPRDRRMERSQARLRPLPLAVAAAPSPRRCSPGCWWAPRASVGGVLKALADTIPFVHVDSGSGVIERACCSSCGCRAR